MRKWIWGFTALMVIGAAVVYLAADHAARHPRSLLGRYATAAGEIGLRFNPFTMLGRVVYQPATRTSTGTAAAVPAVPGDQVFIQVPKPERQVDEVGDEGEAAEPVEVIKVFPAPVMDALARACADNTPQAAEERCETPPPAPEPVTETREPVRYGTAEDEENPVQEVPVATRNLHRPPPMPYADAETPGASTRQPEEADCCSSWFWDFFSKVGFCIPEETGTPSVNQSGDAQGYPAAEESEKTNEQAPAPEDKTESGARSHDAHHQGCPWMGCPYPNRSTAPAYQPRPASDTDSFTPFEATEEQEQPVKPRTPKTHKRHRQSKEQVEKEDVPVRTDVDTMECRPSDGVQDLGSLPF